MSLPISRPFSSKRLRTFSTDIAGLMVSSLETESTPAPRAKLMLSSASRPFTLP